MLHLLHPATSQLSLWLIEILRSSYCRSAIKRHQPSPEDSCIREKKRVFSTEQMTELRHLLICRGNSDLFEDSSFCPILLYSFYGFSIKKNQREKELRKQGQSLLNLSLLILKEHSNSFLTRDVQTNLYTVVNLDWFYKFSSLWWDSSNRLFRYSPLLSSLVSILGVLFQFRLFLI